jgi:hypothetical protein
VKGRVLLDHGVKGSTVHPTTSLAIADMLGGSDQRIDRLLLIWVFAHWCERRARSASAYVLSPTNLLTILPNFAPTHARPEAR